MNTVRRILVNNVSGLPGGRVTIAPATGENVAWMEPADYLFVEDSVATLRYNEACLAHSRDEWYNHHTDNEFIQAFERVLEGAMSNGVAVRIFSRWMATYHPTVPFKFVTLQTGYSQGDWVDMLFVGNPDFWTWVDSPIERSHEALKHIDWAIKALGALTRNDFHKVVFEAVTFEYDSAGDVVNLVWNEDETNHLLALEAFEVTDDDLNEALGMCPWNTAESMWVEEEH